MSLVKYYLKKYDDSLVHCNQVKINNIFIVIIIIIIIIIDYYYNYHLRVGGWNGSKV